MEKKNECPDKAAADDDLVKVYTTAGQHYKMPKEDLNDIMAIQYGFDDYEDMRKQGFHFPWEAA